MKRIVTDIAIIGAGAAGIPAAIESAQAGVRVDVFEQSTGYGGACHGGNGVFAVESRMQKEKQYIYTREEIYRFWMQYTHHLVDAGLVSAFINRSADTVDWLIDYGVDFSDLIAYYPGAKYVWHFRRDGSEEITELLKRASDALGVTYHFQTSVTRLKMRDGVCCGFYASDIEGEVDVDAKAVIIATGGTGKHKNLVKVETGVELGKDITVFPGMLYEDEVLAPKTGVELGWEVGAYRTKLMIDSFASIPDPNFGPGGVPAQLPWFRQPQNICVNLHGERFIDEAEMKNGAFMGNAISIQKDATAFMIFTQAMRESYEKEGMEYVMGNIHYMDNLTADEYMQMNIDRGNKDIMCYASLKDLCEGMGIDERLIDTIYTYNENIKTRKGDPHFHKAHRYLIPIEGGNYYIAKFKRHAYGVMGGLRCNSRTQIIDTGGDPILGLYGAGNDVNSLYGDTYPFEISGNTSSFAINTGRMAGEYAATYVKELIR